MVYEWFIEVDWVIKFREIESHVHVTHLVDDDALVTQQRDKEICVLVQQIYLFECLLERVVVEIVDEVLGHVKNGKPDEERLLYFGHRCIQLDADQNLLVLGCSGDHIISLLLKNGLVFIPRVGELHFYPFSSVSTNLPTACANTSPRWSSTWLVSHSACSHIRI